MSRPPSLRKPLYLTVWSIGMISLLYLSYIDFDYAARMPQEPQPATGRIYPFDWKGQILYVTAREQHRYRVARNIFLGSFVATLVTFYFVRRGSTDRAA